MDIGRIGEPDLIPTSEEDDLQQGSLRLGDDQIVVQPSDEHVVSRPGGEQVDELGQQPRPQVASLRNRTVPQAEARGALAGSLVAAAGVGVATATLIGIGKGALIGAAVGSIIPGAGTVVGAVLGAVVAGVVGGLVASGVGALIGRLVAGGSERDRAEKLTIGLLNEGKITAQEASKLKGMSNSELKELVSISAGKTGITSKADRDDIRRAVLLTAARQGPDAARRRKAALLFSEIVKQRTEVDSKFLKRTIDDQLGRAGAGDEIFEQLDLRGTVKPSDLGRIKIQVDLQAERNRAAGLSEHLPDLAEQVLQNTRAMVNAPPGSTARMNNSEDLFRASGSPARSTAFGKLEGARDVNSANLSHEEAVAALKAIWQATPTMPAEKFTMLMNDEAVSDAVGYFTGKNTVGQKEVPLNSDKASPENMQVGAQRLKKAIEETLTQPEKEALRERAAFLRDMAALSLAKLGLSNDNEDEAEIQKELWIKSIAVSWTMFSGHAGPDVVKASGLDTKDAGVQARDFITACAVHYDTIFGQD